MVRMVEVRRLTPDDAAQLWQLRLTALESEPRAFRETAAEHRRKPLSYFSDRLGATDTNGFVYGAFDDASLSVWPATIAKTNRGPGSGVCS